MKQPYGVLDDMTALDVAWMLEGNLENKKDFFEMVSYSVKNAMASIYQGKDYKLFGENDTDEVDTAPTVEQRQEDLAYLQQKFGEL